VAAEASSTGVREHLVDPERVEERLIDLVRYPSFDGAEEHVIGRLAQVLIEIGADVDVWFDEAAALQQLPGYPGHEVPRARVPVVAARLRGARPGPVVLLTGHVDVVPPGDLSQWTHDPFSGLRVDDRVLGRGSADMKAGIAAQLEVLTVFAESKEKFAGQIVFVAVPGEEDSGIGTLSAIERGWRGDVAFLAEPTVIDGTPTLVSAHAGAMGVSVFVPGSSAHASMRRQGESAFEHYLDIHAALREAERELNEAESDPLMRALDLPYATNVGRIDGGTFISTVMDGLVVQLRMGVCLGETVDEAEARVRRTIAEAAAKNSWLSRNPPVVTVTSRGFGSARTPPEHTAVTALQQAHQAVYGAPPTLRAAPFGCDMAGWVRRAGVPTVLYGPGDIGVAHGSDEWVSLTATVDVAKVLTRATEHVLSIPIEALDGDGGPSLVVQGGRPVTRASRIPPAAARRGGARSPRSSSRKKRG
jgi:acetylornithine deacetylase